MREKVKSKDHSINCPYVYQNSQMARGIMQYIEQDRVSSFKYKCILQEEQTQLSYCLNVNFFCNNDLKYRKVSTSTDDGHGTCQIFNITC